MANLLDDSENTVFVVLLLGVLGLLALAYMEVKDLKVPESLYPASIFADFASFVDEIFQPFKSSPIPGVASASSKAAAPVDKWLGAVFEWLNEHIPAPSQRAAMNRPRNPDGTIAGVGVDDYAANAETEGGA